MDISDDEANGGPAVSDLPLGAGSSNASAQSGQRQNAAELPWVEKYRPNSLDDLIAHEEIVLICMYIKYVYW
jgi:hypothetical protein